MSDEVVRLDRLVTDLLTVAGRRLGEQHDKDLDDMARRRAELLRPIQQAAQQRTGLVELMKKPLAELQRKRVGDYARSWIESKATKLDAATVQTYTDALEDHVLPALGDFYYDQLTSADVQNWIDDEIRRGWTTTDGKGCKTKRKKERRRYKRNSIGVWFRVFRTMTRDAIAALGLPRDPTLRVSLPDDPLHESAPNSVTLEKLVVFLMAMRVHYPQHIGLVATLAYTGLRFCHASALRPEDWDVAASLFRVVRKHYRGKIGPVSRKKRTSPECPIVYDLAEVLREHHERLYPGKPLGQATGGWLFPSATGTLRTPNSLDRAWEKCKRIAGITTRFTPHGLRYTFTDLVRRADVDEVVRKALTGHVTKEMLQHYSTVGLDEKRAAVAGVASLLSGESLRAGGSGGGNAPLPPGELN